MVVVRCGHELLRCSLNVAIPFFVFLSSPPSSFVLLYQRNVEENYWGVAKANRASLGLFDGLMHALKLPKAQEAMRHNAAYIIGRESEAMALSVRVFECVLWYCTVQ